MPETQTTRGRVVDDDPRALDAHDAVLLMTLMHENANGPWAVDELARELEHDVEDELRRLYGAGLIHRLDGFVWATRAAVRADELAG
jgi:predicted transcriptional regulator